MQFSLNRRHCFMVFAVSFFWMACSYNFPLCFIGDGLAQSAANTQADTGKIIVSKLTPDERGGVAYRLIYQIDAPVEAYWRFKTDFNNDFLVGNPHILFHRVISRTEDAVITENRYTDMPDVYFRWRTTIDKAQYRLTFKLLNPEQCQQEFHYGYINLKSIPEGTRVIQVAYLDFFGATLWTLYPWKGGMKDFLVSTAQWEKETFMSLKERYLTGEK